MRVLLATDGSANARAAALWLRDFPLPGVARIRVLTVVTLPPSALDIPQVADLSAGSSPTVSGSSRRPWRCSARAERPPRRT